MEIFSYKFYMGALDGCRAGAATAVAGVLLASTRVFNLLPISLSSAALQGLAMGIIPFALGTLTYYGVGYVVEGLVRRVMKQPDEVGLNDGEDRDLEDLLVEDESEGCIDCYELAELTKSLSAISVTVITAGALGVALGVNPILAVALAALGFAATGSMRFDLYKNFELYERWGLLRFA